MGGPPDRISAKRINDVESLTDLVSTRRKSLPRRSWATDPAKVLALALRSTRTTPLFPKSGIRAMATDVGPVDDATLTACTLVASPASSGTVAIGLAATEKVTLVAVRLSCPSDRVSLPMKRKPRRIP